MTYPFFLVFGESYRNSCIFAIRDSTILLYPLDVPLASVQGLLSFPLEALTWADSAFNLEC